MGYGEAIHGTWCNSRTFPLRCRYCSEEIFFFSCDHGCRVLFDELGPPWPLHNCLGQKIAEFGKENVERALAIGMMLPGVNIGSKIDKKYVEKVKQAQTQPRPPEILRADPYPDAQTSEEGVVREFTREVDIFKKFKVAAGSIASATLGPLAKGKYAQVTIHTGALAGEDNYSFTFFVSHKLLQRLSVITGDFVKCQLRGVQILGNQDIWLCDMLASLFGG